jgi:hypothetical protein
MDPSVQVISLSLHLKKDADPVSEMLCFLVSRMLDDGGSSKNRKF